MGEPDPRWPVLVGVGLAAEEAEPVVLMARAVGRAADDAAGGPGPKARDLLDMVDRIAVPKGTWSYRNPAAAVARRVGVTGARSALVELGIPQQALVNRALASLMAGESRVEVVVGAEARRWARRGAADGGPALETPCPDPTPDEHRFPGPEFLDPSETKAGLLEAVRQYAIIENALRAADGSGLDEHRRDIASLWARFNEVARNNPCAAFPEARSAEQIERPGPENRPLATPYNKWHSTQWTVDQGAALVLCTVEAARELKLPRDRWVHPLAGLESSAVTPLSRRRQLHRWPAMAVLGQAAAQRVGRPLAELETVELYSCFPSAVRVQMRELGLAPGRTPTVTGGMAFAGGPFNNFVLQATAAVVHELRRSPGSLGLVTTVSGWLTKPGLAVWSTRSDDDPPLVADLAERAEAATDSRPADPELDGTGVVAGYTVTFDGLRPERTVALVDTPEGRRVIAWSDDADLALRASTEEMTGAAVKVAGNLLRI